MIKQIIIALVVLNDSSQTHHNQQIAVTIVCRQQAVLVNEPFNNKQIIITGHNIVHTFTIIKLKIMKTINSQINIYGSFNKALLAFNKSKLPCQLLVATNGYYFIDYSKKAIIDWPKNYKLVDEK
ncbi:MAG: hypothetical protein JSU03_05050 [Bacteroidetes bacterium]|nr:hypothetical protein [Bacteroidota bacterium]